MTTLQKYLLYGFILILAYLAFVHSGGAAQVLNALGSSQSNVIKAFQGNG